jgi:hypothetical protein
MAVLLGFQTVALADLVTYTEQITATGSLGSTSFTRAPVTISFKGNTANVTNPSSGLFENVLGTGTVTVAGISATFSDEVGALVNQSSRVAGIEDFTLNALMLNTTNLAFGAYDLTSAIGPVTGGANSTNGLAFATDTGNFIFTRTFGLSTFTASVTPVPEPGTVGLVGLGLVIAAIYYRRSKRASA